MLVSLCHRGGIMEPRVNETEEVEIVQFLLNMTRDLRHRVKILASMEDKTMTDIILEAIEVKVDGIKAP